jgi:LmbE family N-acetylglucosaminyl deacetylase
MAPDAPQALIFSPHPDDEAIVGGLALRLLRQSSWNVINVAVTQGSNRERQPARLAELKACCDHIGFGLMQTAPNGLEQINPAAREREPELWARSVGVVAGILRQNQPRAVFVPHAADQNSTHIGTHLLVMDALRTLPSTFRCFVVETEFWAPMTSPNLMVELGEQDVGDLVAALTFHVGEVQRNPYHLSLPAWMMDNVRRGAEILGGQGGAAPEFTFATLYRVSVWEEGQRRERGVVNRFLGAKDDPAGLF